MRNTAISATHMERSPVRYGGGEMVKVRLQGTKEDMEWFVKQMELLSQVKIIQSSEVFSNKGTNRYFRRYLELERLADKKHM